AGQPTVGAVGRRNDGGQHGGGGRGPHDAFGSGWFNRRAHFRDGARSKGVVTAMSEFFRALEQAGRDRDERLAKQRNNRKPPVAAEPPAQPEPEVPVVAKAGTPRKESQPAAAPTATPTPEPEVVAVAPTITPRHETRAPVAVEIRAPEPEMVATIEAAVATEVEPEPEPEPEIATDIQRAI